MESDPIPSAPIQRFHPVIARWFLDRYKAPTAVQEQAWRHIQAGDHVLATAPTGSGKTLTAFLWAIDQLATGRLSAGQTRVLYVSPLKALNNDIQRNLLAPLAELRQAFQAAGRELPEIRVLTRSGDTPQPHRRRMLHHPPEILITTPESLNLLLASPRARTMLRSVQTLILDEIHAVFASKRGTFLMTAVERLVLLAGEFQRIALSATVNPLESVAAFVGGYRREGLAAAPHFKPRSMAMVAPAVAKEYDLRVCHPPQAAERAEGQPIWEPLAEAFRTRIEHNRATLLFVNNRQLCEQLALRLNRDEDEPLAYAHHGSLAREIRQDVETRFKAGRLKAIVATHSLELGIDIGPLDEVLLVQSPPSMSSAIQRIGRAGHRVGEVSRGSLYPTHPGDFLEAAVLAMHLPDHAVEPQRPVRAPLDVLAQVIVAMTGVDTWDVDELYQQVKTCHAYRHLPRGHFDLVLQMLAGKYARTRLRDLKPRVAIDGLHHTVTARRGALQAVYLSGGVIPDRGYYPLRHARTGARIGDLDEEFVWEARVGQTFSLGAQKWRIEKITPGEVLVVPGHPMSRNTPFWKGEARQRDWHFSEKILLFLQEAEQFLADDGWRRRIRQACRMEPAAAEAMFDFLKEQKKALHNTLPHRHHLVLERVRSAPGAAPGNQVILLNMWGGRVNQPLALALDAAWQEKFGRRVEIFAGNDAIVLQLPHEVDAGDLLSLVGSRNLDRLLRRRLENSGIFGARFRECAGRALLVTRSGFHRRMPLWMSRLRSQRLLDAVRGFDDFPILLETWRTCLQDEFDLERLRALLAELESGAISWTEVRSDRASPMARQMTWRQINTYMYRDDTPGGDGPSRLDDGLLRDIVAHPDLRPSVSRDTVARFEAKSLRLAAGYPPSDALELVEWVKERLLIPDAEWRSLLDRIAADGGFDEPAAATGSRLVYVRSPGAREPWIVAGEVLPALARALGRSAAEMQIAPLAGDVSGIGEDADSAFAEEEDLEEPDLEWLLGEWLRFYGPRPVEQVAATLGIGTGRAAEALDRLVDGGQAVRGPLIKGEPAMVYCDARNLDILLRMERRAIQPVLAPRPCADLAPFLAAVQGLGGGDGDTRPPMERLLEIFERFAGLALDPGLWEGEVLPARLPAYDPAWLDALLQSSDLKWLGHADRRLSFCFEADLDLAMDEDEAAPTPDGDEAEPLHRLLDSAGRYDFASLLRLTGLPSDQAAGLLWGGVWRGVLANDSFAAMRQGIATGFKPSLPEGASRVAVRSRRGGRRGAFARWKAGQPLAGNWYKILYPRLDRDPLARQERQRDRIRMLLDRYGVLFRELLARELPMFRWAELFRTLRLMDLAGEIYSGCFFEGIAGLQFIAPERLSLLQRPSPQPSLFWLNACDPASLCGLGLAPLKGRLPRRIASNHLVYRGAEPVAVSEARGRRIEFHLPPDDPDTGACLGFLHHLLQRAAQPHRRLRVDTINGDPAPRSPYLPHFMDAFEVVRDPQSITLYRRRD